MAEGRTGDPYVLREILLDETVELMQSSKRSLFAVAFAKTFHL
jgi:hypothetical protein